MPEELERLQINIEADASGTAAGAAQAKQALQGLQHDAKRVTDGIQRGMDKAAQATKSVAAAAEITRKTLKPLTENPVNVRAVRQANAAVRATQETVRKTLQPTAPNPVMPNGPGRGKYEFAKMPTKETAAAVQETAKETAKLANNAGNAAEKVREVRKEVERVGRKGPSIMQSIGRSLRSMLIVTAVAGGLRGLIRWLGGVVSADKQVSASLAQVRGNLLSAFAPIYSTIIPAIRTLCSWLATATAWLSSFLGGLFGMSGTSAKDTANNIANIGGAAGGAGKQMKELLGSFDELNKLDRTSGGGGGGGGGGNIEFGEQIDSALNGGSRLQNAFRAVGETVSTFALALGGLKIAQQVAQWLAPLSGIANANAASIGKWGLAITAAVTYLKSLKHVVEDDRFKVRFSEIIDSDDAWWEKGIKLVGLGCEELAAAAIHSVSQFFGVDGVDIWHMLKDWLYRQISEWIKWVPGVGPKFAQAFRELGSSITKWIETHIVQPVKIKWNAFVSWVRGLSISKIFGIGGEQAATITVDTRPAMTSLDLLNKSLDQIDGKTVTATVKIREGGGGSPSSTGGGGRNTTSATASALSSAINSVKNSISKVFGFASGGIGIPRGQLFIANENGAEMVGHIGGKTAVANQQEISGAIWREMQQYRANGTVSGDDIANAVARALNGTSVKVGERQFGTLVVQAVNKNTRQMGRVDFAF